MPTTPYGVYEFPRMSFGLRNAAQTFQRFIDEVLRGLDFNYAYLDDILIASGNHEEHVGHLRLLFQWSKDYGVVINPAKFVIGVTEVDFLGFGVRQHRTRPHSDKVL